MNTPHITAIAADPLTSLRIKHHRLGHVMSDVDNQLDPEGDILAVMGPTGVGKSILGHYLITNAQEAHAEEMLTNPGLIPAIRVEAISSGENSFSWRLFFHSILEALGENLSMPRQEIEFDPKSGRLLRKHRVSTNTMAGLRTAVERALPARGVKFLVIDEAAHIFQQCSQRNLLNHFNTLKSLSNTTGVQLVLLGSYDLYELLFLSGQLARRIQVIHFSRYRQDDDTDVRAFRKCVQQFQNTHKDLWGDTLMQHTDALMENTLGCVGTLKKLLQRAIRFASSRGGWSTEALEAALLTQTQREQILKEILDGEHRIAPGITRELHPDKKTSKPKSSVSTREAA